MIGTNEAEGKSDGAERRPAKLIQRSGGGGIVRNLYCDGTVRTSVLAGAAQL